MNIDVLYLEIANGKSPFLEWEKKLDTRFRAIIRIRINRIRLADYGDCKPIKGTPGLYELRVHIGPGYRIYFGRIKETLVIILSAGDKGSQERDINKAKNYWRLYKESLKK